MRLMLVAAFSTVAGAASAVPDTQPLTCPNAADSCELEIAGKLVYAQRDARAKWDNLRIATTVAGKQVLVYASINIPHRTRLKLKANTRYRFKIAAHQPFGSGDLWVIDAKRT